MPRRGWGGRTQARGRGWTEDLRSHRSTPAQGHASIRQDRSFSAVQSSSRAEDLVLGPYGMLNVLHQLVEDGLHCRVGIWAVVPGRLDRIEPLVADLFRNLNRVGLAVTFRIVVAVTAPRGHRKHRAQPGLARRFIREIADIGICPSA